MHILFYNKNQKYLKWFYCIYSLVFYVIENIYKEFHKSLNYDSKFVLRNKFGKVKQLTMSIATAV